MKVLNWRKFYILPAFKGRRIGKLLLDKAFEIAKFNKRKISWLCVIDTNMETISFYEKSGFKLPSKPALIILNLKKG